MAAIALPQFDGASDGPFSRSAHALRTFGLMPLPLGGNDGKQPLVSYFTKWQRVPAESTLASWIAKWPGANVGIVTADSNVTVVDIDDPSLLERMIERFGDTPLKTGTPSGGVHLWYRSNGERSRVRIDSLRVDLKAAGGMVVVPPSIRASGPYAGLEYSFLTGGWEDLPRLTKVKAGSLDSVDENRSATAQVGQRNNHLFRFLLREAPHCDSQDDLSDVARTWNLNRPEEPLSDSELVRAATSAWKFQTEDRNWVGGSGVCQIPAPLLERLIFFSPKHGADATCLYLTLRKEHAARDDPFPVAPEAMATMEVLPWSEYRIKNALDVLRNFPLLKLVKRGGTGKGDAHLYRFCSSPTPLVPDFRPISNKTPAPLEIGQHDG